MKAFIYQLFSQKSFVTDVGQCYISLCSQYWQRYWKVAIKTFDTVLLPTKMLWEGLRTNIQNWCLWWFFKVPIGNVQISQHATNLFDETQIFVNHKIQNRHPCKLPCFLSTWRYYSKGDTLFLRFLFVAANISFYMGQNI